MPEISRLRRQVPVVVDFSLGEETVAVTFDREAITPALLKRMMDATEQGDLTASAQMLSQIIIEWDITEEGQPWAPSAENLATLSITSLSALTSRISDAAVPSDAEGNASSDTSSTPSTDSTPQPEIRRNGPDPSLSPAPSESLSPT